MDGIGRVESGTETESNARLKGFRRYDPRDGGGRAKQEARAENESGARVEEARAEQLPGLRASIRFQPFTSL